MVIIFVHSGTSSPYQNVTNIATTFAVVARKNPCNMPLFLPELFASSPKIHYQISSKNGWPIRSINTMTILKKDFIWFFCTSYIIYIYIAKTVPKSSNTWIAIVKTNDAGRIQLNLNNLINNAAWVLVNNVITFRQICSMT